LVLKIKYAHGTRQIVIRQYPNVIPMTPKYLPSKIVDNEHAIPPEIEKTKNGSFLWHLR
jgi:hypothetical protein